MALKFRAKIFLARVDEIKNLVKELKCNLDPTAFLILSSILDNIKERNRIIEVLREKAGNIDILTSKEILRILMGQIPSREKIDKNKIQPLVTETRREKNQGKILSTSAFSTLTEYIVPLNEDKSIKTDAKLNDLRLREEIKADINLNIMEAQSTIEAHSGYEIEEAVSIGPEDQFDFEVILSPNVIRINDSVEAFRKLFINRYSTFVKIFLKKGLRNVTTTSGVMKSGKGEYLIILVREKFVTKTGNGLLIGEDLEGEIRVHVPLSGLLARKFKHILLDSVIAIKVKKASKEYCVAEDIIFPDIPHIRERARARQRVKVAFLSDIHIGSKVFLKNAFINFIKFLRGEIKDKKLQLLAKEIKYVIVNGDLVDGVGVYPDQRKELRIVNIYEQYEQAAKYLSQIPKNKLIIIIPGNHDAAGKFVPQPPIPEEIAGALYDLPNIKILGNPALIKLHGVRILLYHGYGLENLAAEIGIGLEKPTRILIETLRIRHLMPEWGRIPIAPIVKDYLIIEEVPDILATGHLHIADVRITKGGILLISSGAFQGLTSWQKQLGIKPTLGIVPIVDLSTYEVSIIKCHDAGCELIAGG